MTKVVFEKGRSGNLKASDVQVGKKRVVDPLGSARLVRTIDAFSPTFTHDLEYVFARNVAKARQDNQRVAGARAKAAKS